MIGLADTETEVKVDLYIEEEGKEMGVEVEVIRVEGIDAL